MEFMYKYFYKFPKEHENEYKKRFESPSAEILELKIRPYRHNELYNLYYIPTSEILNLVYTIEKQLEFGEINKQLAGCSY